MKKPIVGIASKQEEAIDNDLWHRMSMVDEIRYLVNKHGGISIMLLPSEITLDFNSNDYGEDKILTNQEVEDLKRQVDLCDGIILQGGMYSNQFEVEICKYALEKDISILGICAGFNNILRALGSNVYEDKTNLHNHYDKNYRHKIFIEEDSRLYKIIGKSEYEVNSMHTMIADKKNVEGYGSICAYSEDGLIEAFELKNKKFVLALKWHPELMMDEEYVDRLFSEYIASCIE